MNQKKKSFLTSCGLTLVLFFPGECFLPHSFFLVASSLIFSIQRYREASCSGLWPGTETPTWVLPSGEKMRAS